MPKPPARTPGKLSPATERAIGIFDSGVGGLTVVRRIREALPHENLVYLGDTARVPYGNKSPGTVVRFACEDTQFLVARRVKAVVVACNTVSAWALPVLKRRFRVPIFGVIIPGARAALLQSRNRRIGVIGTSATIRSRAYEKSILSREPAAHVFVQACPLLVPLVEEGWIGHPVTRLVLKQYLAPLLRHKIDTLVLGCTHYPLLKETLRTVVGRQVALVESAEACAEFVRHGLASLGLLSSSTTHTGTVQPFVTDDVEHFKETAARFLGKPSLPARQVDLGNSPAPGRCGRKCRRKDRA